MNHRRLVGIDLGIATAHTVRVLDGEGTIVAKRKAWPTVDSLIAVETAALAGCPANTGLEVVIEPTGPAWLPIAVFFSARGHRVFRVSSQKAADLRRFLSRHAKSNSIDAGTLARLPLLGRGKGRAEADRSAAADGEPISPGPLAAVDAVPLDGIGAGVHRHGERIGRLGRLEDKVFLTSVGKRIAGRAEVATRLHRGEPYPLGKVERVAHGVARRLQGLVRGNPVRRVERIHHVDDAEVHEDGVVAAQEGLPGP
jgi:hypothetical protein